MSVNLLYMQRETRRRSAATRNAITAALRLTALATVRIRQSVHAFIARGMPG